MKARYIERLEQVVRVLVELPPEKKFDLQLWMRCGTTGCAIGWAASDPWFNRRGLKLESYVPMFQQRGKPTLWEYNAIKAFFDLSGAETRTLFYAHAYARGSRSDVIRRLNSFIKQKRREAA